MKLENKSPVIAAIATSVPTPGATPTNGALAVVTGIDNRMPRRVFDDHNSGLWSKNVIPASTARAKRRPNISLAMSGVPFATVKSAINCRIARGCIAVACLKIAQLSCPNTSVESFRRDFRDPPARWIFRPELPHQMSFASHRCCATWQFNYQMREVLALDKHHQTIFVD
jgi:hypothetical protein